MRERGRNLIRCGAAFAVSCCLLAGNVFPAAADTSVSGATMRLSSREGTVNVSGKGGKAVASFDNMRLQSGYNLETEAASYAGLALDDVKAVKMDELSKGEIRKKGKQLELLLSEGSLLCDVTAPLKGEESLSIRTSTMITGIRGTVVYAEVVDSNTSRVCVLEGQVLVRPVNPVEGDRNGQYIEKGRQALIIGPDRMERKGEIQTLPLTEADIAPYVLWEIHENEELARRLREAGWDVDWMIENAERLLREEEDKNSQWAEKGQGTSGSKPGGKDIHTPLFNGGDSGSDSGTGTQPGRPTVELTMPVSPETIEEKLRTSDVVLHSAADSNPLIIDNSLTVPAGSRLELAGGMGLVVGTSAALQVDGTLIVDGNLENRGTVTNTSMNTLDIKGDYVGSGTLNNKGRVAANGSFMQEGGSFQTIGQGRLEVERKAVIDNAAFDFGTGTTLFHGDLTVRNADGEFGDNLCVEGMLSLEDSSILITGGFYSGGITAVKKQDGENIAYEELNLEGGKVLAERGVKGVIFAENYKLNVQSGILERSDDGIPFITGTGILEMDGEEYKIEELTESMFESEETETGWVLTGIVQEQKKQAEVLTSIPLQADAEKLPDVNEEEKELQEGENLPEEDLDHIIGIPLFKPLFQTGRRICFYGESRNGRSLKQQLNLFIGPPYWPVSLSQCSASIEYYEVEAGKVLSLSLPQYVQILPIRSNHPDQTVLYRIQLEETMVFYGLDCELNQEMTDVLSNYAENAGLLICDVQYSPEDYIFHKGWGHSTWEAALRLAEASSAKRIWLTHFDWEADSSTLFCLERQATLCNPNCEYVREGMTVWL